MMTKNQRQKRIIEEQSNEIAGLKLRIASYERLYGEKIEENVQLSEKLTEADSDRPIDVNVVIQHLRDYQGVIQHVRSALQICSGPGEPAGIAYFLTGRQLQAKDMEVAKAIAWLNTYQWGD